MFQVAVKHRVTKEIKFHYGTEIEVRPATWGDNCFDVHVKPAVKDRFFPHRNDEWHLYRTDDPVYIRTGRIYNGTFYEMDNLPEEYRDELIAEAILSREEKNENIPMMEF